MTTKELFDKHKKYCYVWIDDIEAHFIDEEDFTKALKEFAEYHVRKALEKASNEAGLTYGHALWNKGRLTINKDSILNSYSSDKII